MNGKFMFYCNNVFFFIKLEGKKTFKKCQEQQIYFLSISTAFVGFSPQNGVNKNIYTTLIYYFLSFEVFSSFYSFIVKFVRAFSVHFCCIICTLENKAKLPLESRKKIVFFCDIFLFIMVNRLADSLFLRLCD